MIYCLAPAITWALVFSGPQTTSALPTVAGMRCYSQETMCLDAMEIAMQAFYLDGSTYRATCEQQPASRDGQPNNTFFSPWLFHHDAHNDQ